MAYHVVSTNFVNGALKCTKISGPPLLFGVMKPNPFGCVENFTLPSCMLKKFDLTNCVIIFLDI